MYRILFAPPGRLGTQQPNAGADRGPGGDRLMIHLLMFMIHFFALLIFFPALLITIPLHILLAR